MNNKGVCREAYGFSGSIFPDYFNNKRSMYLLLNVYVNNLLLVALKILVLVSQPFSCKSLATFI